MEIKEKSQQKNLDKMALLNKLYSTYKNSDQCHVGYKERKNIVFGEGDPNATLMFIGEAPGKEEDEQARPFVGKSGKLLNKALDVAQISRKDSYITNVLKCRPENNRTPTDEEIKMCKERFLDNQIEIIKPKIIVTLGAIATKALLSQDAKITKIHGQIFKQKKFIIIPIYHPSYVLRNQTLIEKWLEDFNKIKEILNQADKN